MDPDALELLPIDPETGEPLRPRAQPGYYPDFHVLDEQDFWDDATRRVVLDRVNNVPPLRFFSPDEAKLMGAVFDRLLPQEDRDAAHRIPILNFVDERLYLNQGDGYRYENMPEDRDAYRIGMRALQALAQAVHGKPFEALEPFAQEELLKRLHDGKPAVAEEVWSELPAHRFFLLLMHDATRVYYAHPFAWDEIGYGGPAYPRGYMRLVNGEPEPWECEEQRYEWEPPRGSHSGALEPIAGSTEHPAPPGQGGTH